MKPISKTLFLKGMNCAKYIFLEYNHPELKDSTTFNGIAIENGKLVGLFGRELYKGGIDLTEEGKYYGQELINRTQSALITSQNGIFYEAAFVSKDNQYMCQADVLSLSNKNNSVVEFKSSTKVKLPTHIYDIGWQWKVINDSDFGKKMKYYLAYINSDYIRDGDIDIEKLFIHEDVTIKAMQVQFIVDKHLQQFEKVLSKKYAPNVKVGKHCTSPYKCEFYKHCWKNIPETSLVNIGGIRKNKLASLERAGIDDIKDIPPDVELTENLRIQIESALSHSVRINKRGIQQFINSLNIEGPIAFMDFETTMNPIPKYDGCYPYMQLPFQYCIIQRLDSKRDYITKEFIAKPDKDPRKDFIENLLLDLNTQGTIIVYNESFEKSRLLELAELFPEYSASILSVIARIKDLIIPFREKHYYHPSFKGKYSIKVVLPVLCPELNYDQLTIQNGTMAMENYTRLETAEKNEYNKIINNLREYCNLDVIAMVKILESLQRIVNSKSKNENKS